LSEVNGLFTPSERLTGVRRLPVVPGWYRRLDEHEAEALRRRAAREGRSMQEVARQAVRAYIERTSRRELLDEVLDEELPRYAEALERLGR
jgi:plasmid stability protein